MKTNYYIVKSEISKDIDLETGWIAPEFIESDFRESLAEKGFPYLKTLKVYKCENKKEYNKFKNNIN